MNKEERILGIDYGTKRIGIAMSDPLGIFAIPLETVKRKNIRKVLQALLTQYDVTCIVVGNPLRTDGKRGKREEEVEEFVEQIREEITVTIELWDERFSTIEAEHVMRDKGEKPSRNKEKVDKIAASLILQSYLDYKKGEKNTA